MSCRLFKLNYCLPVPDLQMLIHRVTHGYHPRQNKKDQNEVASKLPD